MLNLKMIPCGVRSKRRTNPDSLILQHQANSFDAKAEEAACHVSAECSCCRVTPTLHTSEACETSTVEGLWTMSLLPIAHTLHWALCACLLVYDPMSFLELSVFGSGRSPTSAP